MVRKSAVVLIAVAVMAMLFGAAPARADRPLPSVTIWGHDIGTLGNHDYCRGSFRISLSTVKSKRGYVRVTATSHGFTGNGAGWSRNPRCSFLIGLVTIGSNSFYGEHYVPATFGRKPGQKVVRDVRTGSGPAQVGVQTYAARTAVRTPLAYGSVFYMIVP